MTAASPPLNCSLALPPTPAPSLTCLEEELATASPSCLGGGSWCVGATKTSWATRTRAYPGLQATQAGRISSISGKSINIFPKESKTQLTARRDMVTLRGRRPLNRTPSSCSAVGQVQRSSLPRSCQVFQNKILILQLCPGGENFTLSHSGYAACGIPDGETIVMTGGGHGSNSHSFVTRYITSARSTNTAAEILIVINLCSALQHL